MSPSARRSPWAPARSCATNVPDGCLVAGAPARIRRRGAQAPSLTDSIARARLIHGVLERWSRTLPVKGVDVLDDRVAEAGRLTAVHEGRRETVALGIANDADITLALGPGAGSRCHFDLEAGTLVGDPSPLAEDLRDFLRRNAIRVFTDRPFQALAPANLARLRAGRG